MIPTTRLCLRRCHTLANSTVNTTQPVSKTCHKVLVSKSNNIFENLALEDWLHEKADLNEKSILLMWSNRPAVVIGRHQNPWVECNVPAISKSDISLARRRSGGNFYLLILKALRLQNFQTAKKLKHLLTITVNIWLQRF